jgi:hypothetical protein
VRGQPFVKDSLEVIRLDYEIFELTSHHEKETEKLNKEKEALEEK